MYISKAVWVCPEHDVLFNISVCLVNMEKKNSSNPRGCSILSSLDVRMIHGFVSHYVFQEITYTKKHVSPPPWNANVKALWFGFCAE